MTLKSIQWSECHMKKDAEVLRYMRERAPWYQSGTGCLCWLLGSSVQKKKLIEGNGCPPSHFIVRRTPGNGNRT